MLNYVGGNSGYVGYSQSKRSLCAKLEGRFPKTQFKKEYGISEKQFGTLLAEGIIENTEWHHTSMYGNKTKFYAVVDAVLFNVKLGRKEEAFKLYKETRNYAVPVSTHSSQANATLFLGLAANYGYTIGARTGDTFEFNGVKVKVVSQTKRKRLPVCSFSK